MDNNARKLSFLVALLVLAIVAGCGGGSGSSGGAGGGGSGNALTYSPAVFSVTLPVNAPVDPASGRPLNGILAVTIGNVPAATQALGGQYTADGIETAEVTAASGSTATLTVYLLKPEMLVPGTYNERVTLHACTDAACNSPIAGTDATLSITYKVTAPAAGREPAIQLTPSAVVVGALALDPSSVGPHATVQFNLQNFGAQPYVKVEHSTSAIQIINTNTGSTTRGSVDLAFQAPSVLGRGVYSDPLTITVCLDSNCANPVAGSPFTIPVTYAIDDTIAVPGPNGYTLRAMQVTALGWAWDEAHGWLLVTTKYDNNLQSFLLAVDPQSGTVVSRTLLDGFATAVVEVSDDNRYVYVGVDASVERFTLPDLQRDLTVSMGRDPSNTSLYSVRNLRVLPGAPHSFAVAMYSGAYEQLAVFDDGSMRTNVLVAQPGGSGAPAAEHLQWGSDAGTLYGVGYGAAGIWNFYVMRVDATGITGQQTYADLPNPDFAGRNPDVLHPGGGLLYTETGFAIDPATGTVARQLAMDSTYYGTQTDEASGRLYSLGSTPGQAAAELRILNLADASQVAHVTLPDFVSILPHTLMRWGSQGLVYGDGGDIPTNYLVFVSGPVLAP
jgi:hypothetical protein